MGRFKKVSVILVSLMLVFSTVLGFVTKNSFNAVEDTDQAKIDSEMCDIIESINNKISLKKVKKQINKTECAFVVTVKENLRYYEATKTLVHIDKVIKGDEAYSDTDVYIYELNYIQYFDYTDRVAYRFNTYVNNIMSPGRQYLVFCDRLYYDESYQENIKFFEFNIDWRKISYIYSFPIEKNIDWIAGKEDVTYADFKYLDYLCMNKEQAEKLESIRASILKEYLNL